MSIGSFSVGGVASLATASRMTVNQVGVKNNGCVWGPVGAALGDVYGQLKRSTVTWSIAQQGKHAGIAQQAERVSWSWRFRAPCRGPQQHLLAAHNPLISSLARRLIRRSWSMLRCPGSC